MFDYRLKKDNFINNKYIRVFEVTCTIKYQISDDYYTEDCWLGKIITNTFLCDKICDINFK